MSTFLDDVAEKLAFSGVNGFSSALDNISKQFTVSLHTIHVRQYMNKMQVRFRAVGKGCKHVARNVAHGHTHVHNLCRYLGPHIQSDGNICREITFRAKAMDEAMRVFRRLWNSMCAFRCKSLVFDACAFNACITGLEALVFTNKQTDILTAKVVAHARTVMVGKACHKATNEGETRPIKR